MTTPAPNPDPEPTGDPWHELPLLLTIPATAALLGISRSAAYRLAETGELPVKRMGGRLYIHTTHLKNLLDTTTNPGEAAA